MVEQDYRGYIILCDDFKETVECANYLNSIGYEMAEYFKEQAFKDIENDTVSFSDSKHLTINQKEFKISNRTGNTDLKGFTKITYKKIKEKNEILNFIKNSNF